MEVEFSLQDLATLMLCERGRMEEHRASARARHVIEVLIVELDKEHNSTMDATARGEGRKRKATRTSDFGRATSPTKRRRVIAEPWEGEADEEEGEGQEPEEESSGRSGSGNGCSGSSSSDHDDLRDSDGEYVDE